MGESLNLIDFDRIVSLNESAAYVWENLPASGFDMATITHLLTDRYDVEEATAERDARELAEVWLKAGVIEEEK